MPLERAEARSHGDGWKDHHLPVRFGLFQASNEPTGSYQNGDARDGSHFVAEHLASFGSLTVLPVHFKARISTVLAVVLMDDEFDGVREGIQAARRRRLGCDLAIVADCRGPNEGSVLNQKGAIAAEYIVRDLNF